jgi:hypothetical protein
MFKGVKEHGVVQMYLSNILYIDFSKSFDGRNFFEFTRNLLQYNIFPFSRDSWTFRKVPTLSSSIKRTLSFSSSSPARVAPLKIQQIRYLVNL